MLLLGSTTDSAFTYIRCEEVLGCSLRDSCMPVMATSLGSCNVASVARYRRETVL